MKNQTESETKKSTEENVAKDNPEQSQRFVETARELECDEGGVEFEKVIGAIKS